MPSKRTNDSVDRIMEDLNRRQTAAGLNASVTDHQVDEILRSVGISTTPLQGTPEQDSRIAFADSMDDLPQGDFLQQAAPAAPVQSTPAAPVRPAPQAPQTRPAPPVQPAPQPTHNTVSDTTSTSIIKGLFLKMVPDADGNTDALNQSKKQFQKFFRESVAVVPDEKGRIRQPAKKKRGLFGHPAEDTDEFVPINVSLSAAQNTADDQPEDTQEEYYPDREKTAAEEPAAPRKHGFFGNLFNQREEDGYDDDLLIPQERQDEPTLAPIAQEPRPAEPAAEVRRSKYTRPAEATVPAAPAPVRPAAPAATVTGQTGTIYRKKRNTIEFTPRQKKSTPPPVQPLPFGEPAGEPLDLPAQPAAPAASTGFTMQLNSAVQTPSDSTQEFMNAYNAVRPKAVQTQPAAPLADGYAVPQRDAVDDLVDTLTGRIRLTPAADQPDDITRIMPAATESPAAAGDTTRILPQTEAHTGFTQNLGGIPAAPARAGFTQPLNPAASAAPAQAAPAHSGFTQSLGEEVPPETGSFVGNIADAINNDTIRPADPYQAAADRLTASLADDAADSGTLRDKMRRGAMRLTGKPEDETQQGTAPFETSELPPLRRRDYESADDAPAIRRDLDKNVLLQTVACIVSGAIAAVLLVLAVMASLLPALPGPLADSTVYTAVALILLLCAAGVSWQTMLNGLLGLFKTPTPDSLTILPVIAAAVQCLAALLGRNTADEFALLAGPAVLVLCVNNIGKRLHAATVQENFRLVSAKVDHAVAYRLKDSGALNAITQGLAEPRPSVLVSRPTQIFRSFLANSAAHGTSDKNQQQFAWLVGGCALAGFLFTLIRTKSFANAAAVMASITCLAAPLAGTLLAALPARMMQRSAAQVGAVIPGWRDIRQLGRINVIQVTARDLFPQGCVSLVGIKPVKPEHIDIAIVYAASILSEASPTLRDIFLGMLGENRNLLAKVDDRETIYGKGYVGWVNKRRVLVGNRALMQDYGVKIPSLEFEQHHTVNQRRVIYLAVSGKLFAIFQIAYQRDPDTAIVLESLRRSGLSLVVDCDDFNCDTALLEAAYSLPAGAVKVLNAREHDSLAPATAWLPESEGNMLHLGSFASFVGGLEAAAGAANGERRAAAVVSASVLLSCLLGVLLTLTGGLTALPLPALVLYQAAWCVLALVFPLTQRY